MSEKREEALKATLELIAEQGFHAAPMSQIAKKANIGVGTIYRYFSSKEDLINALYIDVKANLSKHVYENYSEDYPPQQSFKQVIKVITDYFIDNPNELSFVEQYENSPLITEATLKESSRMTDPMDEIFKSAIRQGLIKDLPIEIAGALIGGATISLAKLFLSKKANADTQTLSKAVDALWDMIKK